MKFGSWIAAAAAAACAAAFCGPLIVRAQPAAPDGAALFNARCGACHEPPVGRAPARASLAVLPAAQIVEVLTSGVMAPMATGLSAEDKQAIADYLTARGAEGPYAHPGQQAAATPARRGGFRPPPGVDPKCDGAAPPIRQTGSDWASVGVDAASRRFQRDPDLAKADVARLKLKWAYSMVGGGMPTVIGDWLFVTNRNGKFYALDARKGCVRWVAEGVASRTTPMIVKSAISPSGWATFVGERNRTVGAFDAQTGKAIWRSAPLESNPVAGITGTPVVSGGQLFVPMSSGEEGAATQAAYPCCSFRGSLSALDLETGQIQWKTYVITEPLHPTRKTAAGTQLQGPAGGAIWSAPTADAKRGLVYVATGDSYTEVPTAGADAIVAIEMATGKVRWKRQVTPGDNFIMGCNGATRGANCPNPIGPDYDFGASPILFKLPSGKQVVLSGQKSGTVYGMDPDTGRLLWSTKVGSGSALGGIEWGMAADDKRLYVANADTINLFDDVMRAQGKPPVEGENGPAKPGLYALDPATGKILWAAPAPDAPCRYAGDRSRDYAGGRCIRAQSAAPSVIPGVVFSGTTDGWLRAYDTASGKILWQTSTTAQTYDTLNQIKAQPGGSIDGLGPAVASGMVYVMSGFNGASRTGGNGVNVLLAYSVDGR
ncbi:PQQ-binding-like beta-propeller repeat protein [Phenylobacterium sp.]|uniref:outer membrane protein assembly factor BamB family protein n=1 Tax=Phenylobacterium sp. TaxID=1871053 RepID=UPI00260B2FAB|nr:PQQ-binding-like beta-propeller repeat protein [Phenylobacterium sp.]